MTKFLMILSQGGKKHKYHKWHHRQPAEYLQTEKGERAWCSETIKAKTSKKNWTWTSSTVPIPMALPRRPYLLGLLPGTSNDWATQKERRYRDRKRDDNKNRGETDKGGVRGKTWDIYKYTVYEIQYSKTCCSNKIRHESAGETF